MRIAAILSAVLFAACGGEKPTPDESVGRLLHKDAQIVFGFSSIGDADALMEALVPAGAGMSLSGLLSSLPGAGPRSFREDSPLAFAVSLPRDGSDPEFSAAIPANDPDGLADRFKEGSARALGDYVGLSSRQAYPEGGCGLWSGLPKGDMCGRLDMVALGGSENPTVDFFLRQAADVSQLVLGVMGAAVPGFDPEQTVRDLESWLREVVDSGERLDFVMDLDDTSFRGEVAYTARPGTGFAEAASRRGGLSVLAAHAPDGWPYLLLLRLDPAWIARVAGLAELEPAFKGLTGDWLVSGRMDGSGVRLVIATRAADGAGAGAALAALLAAAPIAEHGFVCTEEKTDAKDSFARRFRITVDSERFAAEAGEGRAAAAAAFFGPKGIAVEIAARKDVLLVAVGGEDGLAARLLGSSKPPAALARQLSGLSGDVRLLVAMDTGALVTGMKEMFARAGEAETEGFDPPALAGSVEAYGVASDRTWRWGFRADRTYFDAMRQLQMARQPGPPPPPPRAR